MTSTARLNTAQAINLALDEEMARDERVLLIGEDLRVWGGPFAVCKGLYDKYPDRVLNAPISEGGFVGLAVGAAATGLRPIVELMFCDFLGVCLDPLMNSAAKLRYITGGQFEVPIVVRVAAGAGHNLGATHSQTLYSIVAHVPGLQVIAPSTPGDAYGLLKSAIRSDDPVVFFENKMLYFRPREEVDTSGENLIPIGSAAIKRRGSDVTVVGIARAVHWAIEAAHSLQEEGISIEVIDPRSLVPLDLDTICESVARTGRLLVVDEASSRASIGADIVARIAMKSFGDLTAPPMLYTSADTPVPFAPNLEAAYLPSAYGIVKRIKEAVDA